MTEHLFQLGNFTLHTGASSTYKIECDALSAGDWDCVAALLAERLPTFGMVKGIPRGGVALSAALIPHLTPDAKRVLIVDDVLTSGGSMEVERAKQQRDIASTRIIGAVLFARGPCPDWITSLFTMAPEQP